PARITGSTKRVTQRTSSSGARHEDDALEQVDVLLVLEQRAVQRRNERLAIAALQRFGRNVFGQQQFEPVEELGGRRLLLEARHFAQVEEHFERFGEQRLL